MGPRQQHAHAAVVWLDHWHALVARRDGPSAEIVDLDRGADSQPEFLARVTELTDDCDRLMILGPGGDGMDLERAYVGHHGGHVVALDIEASAAATPAELYDRLRLLENAVEAPGSGAVDRQRPASRDLRWPGGSACWTARRLLEP